MEGWISNARSTVEAGGQGDEGGPWSLPPGFRFHPTDEELVTFYLANRIHDCKFTHRAISEADLNSCEPWELPGKAKMGEKEWYFYTLKDRKYPTGIRTNRATQAGYWKATGKDREVMISGSGKLVGMKKTLVFYTGRAPAGLKSNWVMHEYRAEANIKQGLKHRSTKDEWVLCRIFHKSSGRKKTSLADLQRPNGLLGGGGGAHTDARLAKIAATLPALMELPFSTTSTFLGPLPSPQTHGHAPPRNAHLANYLPFASTTTTNFSAASDYSLNSSVLTALFHNFTHNHATSPQYHAIKPKLSCTVDVTSSCSSAIISDYTPQVINANLPLLQDHGHQLVNRNTCTSSQPSFQEQHNRLVTSRLQPMISFDGNNVTPPAIILSPEAISDSCTTEYVPLPSIHHRPQLPRLPSDLESLWMYADPEPV